MKIPVILSLTLASLGGCGSESTSSTKDFTKSESFVFVRNIPIAIDIERRLSLIAPRDITTNLNLLSGTSDPFALALATDDTFANYNGFFHIHSRHLLRLVPSTELVELSAELLDYKSGRAIGRLDYSFATDFPHEPMQVTELCTGTYEHVCTIGYDLQARLYTLDFYPGTDNNEPPSGLPL